MMLLDAGIGASRGDAVLALLERAKVPPVPPFYKLCYDYLAGVRTLDTIRANAIIEAEDPGKPASEQMYDDFVAPYETKEAVTTVVSRMIDRITVLETLVIESQEATRSQAADLAVAVEDLQADDLDPALLRDWIIRLQATNDVLRSTNATLSGELETSLEVFTTAQDEMAALSRAASIDTLTGICNRAGVEQALEAMLPDVNAGNGRMSLAIVDVDHFKKLNDTYGHQIGDEILRLVGRALMTSTRGDMDTIGRMGGDEFVVIIRDEDLPGARLMAERVRRAVFDCDLTRILGKGVLGNVTASIGVAQFEPGDSLHSLFERADKCLFEAKNRGRNQVVAETPAKRAA